MVEGLIGKKVGMTQVFDDYGDAVSVTVIQAGPCVVVQKKTLEQEGYEAVQLGFVDSGRKSKANKPMAGHFKNADVPPVSVLKEFRYSEEEESPVSVGDQVLVKDVFEVSDRVNVAGKGKGRGFQGVIKRHGFHGGRATHGSMFHRAPGSIGASAYPSRVFAGMKGPGRMGNKNLTIRNLRVVSIDEENNLILVKGSVPGARGGYVLLHRAD
jgi:large subunit ribosomal protein L3